MRLSVCCSEPEGRLSVQSFVKHLGVAPVVVQRLFPCRQVGLVTGQETVLPEPVSGAGGQYDELVGIYSFCFCFNCLQ